jgi:hypothetical protein
LKKSRILPNFLFAVLVGFFMTACGGGSSNSGNGGTKAAPAGVSGSSGTLTTYKAPTKVSGTGKRLLAVYMVGSDLESQSNAGTEDFNEMVTGYNTLTTAEKNSIDLVVAFGGANKSGWKGMKIATMSQIVADSLDGNYGNETGANSYQYKADKAHMGDKSSLKLFLKYLKDGYPDHEVQFFVFWDHGSTYTGFGNDEMYNSDPLYLSEINTAFADSGSPKFTMIGFDACLQASIETSRFMKSYSDYLLASEELEPGHGWLWSTVLTKFTKTDFGNNTNPASTVQTIGKALCDNFILDVHSYKSSGKTLSIADMTKFSTLETKLNAVLTDYTANMSTSEYPQGILYATTNAQAYGKNEKENTKNAVDIKDFALKLKEKTTSATLKIKLNDLIASVGDYVVYTKNDGANPRSNGVAFCPPEDIFQPSLDSEKVNQTFLTFQTAYKNKKSQDVTPPTVTSGTTNTAASASSFNFTTTAATITTSLKGKSVVLKYKDNSSTDKFNANFTDGTKVKAYWNSVGSTTAADGKWELSGTDINITFSRSAIILEPNTKNIIVGTTINIYEYPAGSTSATGKVMIVESITDLSNPSVVSDGGTTTTTSSVASTTIIFESGDSVVLKSNGTATGSFAGSTFTTGKFTLDSDGISLYIKKKSFYIYVLGSLQAGTEIYYYAYNASGAITIDGESDFITSVTTTGVATKKEEVVEVNVAPFLIGERAAFVSLTDPKKGKFDDNVTGTVTTFTEENLKAVTTIYGFFQTVPGETDPYFLSVAELEAYQTENENEFFTPKWNKNWYTLKYTSDESKDTQWMPMIFAGRTTINGQEFVKYHAEIDYYDSEKTYEGEDKYDYAVLEIVVDSENEIVEQQVTPYQVLFEDEDDTVGRVQFSKIKKQLKSGDKIQFYTYGFNIEDPTKDSWFEASDILVVDTTPEFLVELLEFIDENDNPLDYKYSMFAEDINGNGILTDPENAE